MSLYTTLGPLVRRLPPGLQTRLEEVRATRLVARQSADYAPVRRSVARMLLAPRRRVLCDRHAMRHRAVLPKLFAVNRYRPVFDARHAHDVSLMSPSVAPSGRPALNGRYTTNQKVAVAEAWAEAAGYALAVDPTAFGGPMVEKSDDNATHDGRVVAGPVAAHEVVPGKVYQRLVDNSDGDEVVDLRTPLYGGAPPFVYAKRRPLGDRFSNANSSVEVREAADTFSADELGALARFAEIMGLDYGEVDVLRDNATGRIYVVDSSDGPSGPPNGLPAPAARAAVARLASALDAVVGGLVAGPGRA